ncbi:MAG TPA: DUF5615 family PIN-like protein [Chloroflexota bacterium]|nr:DUF5615 family PIN-like protein [Chloroflexota bacterium]HUM70346.1 DUF5615 family PIN-like protein [Chloroflexota bacterium]
MNFLVDAHLPRRLATLLRQTGHDAIHTRDLPNQNRTSDEVINQLSIDQQRIVITKDADFVHSHLVRGRPHKLLLISTGNIKNDDLLWLFEQNLAQLTEAFVACSFVELDRNHLIIHQ